MKLETKRYVISEKIVKKAVILVTLFIDGFNRLSKFWSHWAPAVKSEYKPSGSLNFLSKCDKSSLRRLSVTLKYIETDFIKFWDYHTQLSMLSGESMVFCLDDIRIVIDVFTTVFNTLKPHYTCCINWSILVHVFPSIDQKLMLAFCLMLKVLPEMQTYCHFRRSTSAPSKTNVIKVLLPV